MALALDAPYAAAPARPLITTGTFAVPALASLGAGAVHAAAIGAHNEHRQAVVTFAVVAAVQLGLGAISLVTNRRLVGLALAGVNLAFLAGWAMAKASGIGFVEGLDEKEAAQYADVLAASLAAATVVGVAITALRRWQFPASDSVVRVLALPVAALAVTGMVAAGGHAHAGTGHGDDHAAAAGTGAAHADDHAATGAVAKPFDPNLPIDLSGTPGVTPQEQAQAENVLAASLQLLPRWADYKVAEAEGWSSIGDGITGHEHFVNPATFDDGRILDPSAPESLVYEFDSATKSRKLVAAMYMLPPGSTLDDVPPIGGELMQWHIHDNLCFSAAGKVASLRAPGGPCPEGLFVGGENPMIHVWITSHPCGPFAALEGIAGGSIAAGESRLCDTAHGAGHGH